MAARLRPTVRRRSGISTQRLRERGSIPCSTSSPGGTAFASAPTICLTSSRPIRQVSRCAFAPSGGLRGRDSGEVAALLRVVAPTEDLRGPGLDGWAATEIDRMAVLLRKAGVAIGLVTDGRWWAIVWAEEGKPTGSGIVDALTWAEEPLLRDAFLTLIDQQRLRAKNPEHRLPRLLQRSELEAEEITEALGTQVRKSVELLVQAFSEARLDRSRERRAGSADREAGRGLPGRGHRDDAGGLPAVRRGARNAADRAALLGLLRDPRPARRPQGPGRRTARSTSTSPTTPGTGCSRSAMRCTPE